MTRLLRVDNVTLKTFVWYNVCLLTFQPLVLMIGVTFSFGKLVPFYMPSRYHNEENHTKKVPFYCFILCRKKKRILCVLLTTRCALV
jgi:hypothetical protein